MPVGGRSAGYLSITKGNIFCAKERQKVKVIVSLAFKKRPLF